MDCFGNWKKWIRPAVMTTYCALAIFVALPLCVIELNKEGSPTHVQAWFAAGVFVLCAIPISLYGILQHLVNYTKPVLQRHIIRVLWMVPIYAGNAWLALRFPSSTIYLDTLRECYEAYVIYNFMAYLLNFLWIEHPQLDLYITHKDTVKHIFPLCCLPPFPKNHFISYCKHGVLQYTVIRPFTTIIALICELARKYHEGEFDFKAAWPYLMFVNNFSQIWAMYCLVLFYKAMKEELAPIKPVPKFLCVKFVVFFSFWQAVLIAVLNELNLIPSGGKWVFYDDKEQVAAGIQDFCICVEMFVAAIAHYYSFSHKPYVDQDFERGNCCATFMAIWDVSDMKDDVVEHVKVIGKSVKKTVSKPFIGERTERTPLLSDSTQNVEEAASYVGAENRVQSKYQSYGFDQASLTSGDWDVRSMESADNIRRQSAATESMNNYALFSTSGDYNLAKGIKEEAEGSLGSEAEGQNKHVGNECDSTCTPDMLGRKGSDIHVVSNCSGHQTGETIEVDDCDNSNDTDNVSVSDNSNKEVEHV